MLFTETSGCFSPGLLVVTPGLLEQVPHEEILAAYTRHLNCDWGDVSDGDKQNNDLALQSRRQVLDHHRGRPVRDDMPAPQRVLKVG